ncbi:MAG: aldo/keto reductase [Candidatus Woesearchaeota archaeon]
MEYKKFKSGLNVPVIGFGTWQIGGRTEPDYSNDTENISSIKNALKLGYTLIDTAESYGAGHTEELIGQAIRDFPRDKLFIISKVYKTNLGYDNVIKSAKSSLERLKIDCFDLYLIHFPNEDISLQETMRAMDFLIDNKLTRFIGVSNFSVKKLIEAQKYSKYKIVANQIQYNLVTRNNCTYNKCVNMESEIIPYCQENDILIIADRPLDKGALISGDTNITSALDMLCKKYGKTRSQIALNWLISKKNIITIPMSLNFVHQKENLEITNWALSPEDIILLDNLSVEHNISF